MSITKWFACIAFWIFLLGFVIPTHGYNLYERVGIASSPNSVGSGARAIGMGGAFIGIADDATAASWNPAGLIQLEKPELSIVGAYFKRSEDFTSSMNPEIANTATADDANLNYLSASLPFNFLKRNMVVSINYQRLYEFKRDYEYHLEQSSPLETSSEGRHYDQDGYLGAMGIAYTVEITPKVSLGGTLNIWTDDLFWENGWQENYKQHSVTTTGAYRVIEDTAISDNYNEFSGLNANIGVLWNAFRNFTDRCRDQDALHGIG